jgi:hypothetical protein
VGALEDFVQARLSIINDPTASAGDRLRAMEQLESRALAKPKETVEHQASATGEHEAALLQLTPDERQALLRAVPDGDLDAAQG